MIRDNRHKDYDSMENILAHINAAREALGMSKIDDMPEGVRENCILCPVAKALMDDGDHWHGYEIEVYGDLITVNNNHAAEMIASAWNEEVKEDHQGGKYVYLPPVLQYFIAYFDGGKCPQYEMEIGEGR